MGQASFKYRSLAQKLVREIASAGLREGDRLPTEDDLVQKHGLSRITVRRALSLLEADGLISRKRRAGTFISRAIEQAPLLLGAARGTIAVVLSPLQASAVDEDNIAASYGLHVTLRALEQRLADHGYNLQVLSVGRHELQDRSRLAALAQRQDIRGVCVHGSDFAAYRQLLGDVPMLCCCTYAPVGQPWIGWNLEDAACACVKHLAEHRHQRIALVAGPWVARQEFPSFMRGYRKACDELGLPFRRNLLYHAYEHESLPELMEQALSAEPRPTALIAQDWRVTRAALAAAAQLGLRIPDDLSLLALGENAQHIGSSVSISAYVPDNAAVGRKIAEVLVALIDGEPVQHEPIFVPGKLIEQQSVAPPGDFQAVG